MKGAAPAEPSVRLVNVIITVLATRGYLMAAVPGVLIGVVLGASAVLAFILDAVKAAMSRSLRMQ